MERTCLECGESIVGRADKKFCCDTCRSAYHNTLNRDSNNLIRNTHNRLRKNYRILENLNPRGETKVAMTTLVRLGFDFDLLTGVGTNQKGQTYYFIYDQGYLPIENGLYLLIKRHEEELLPTASF